MKWIGFYDYTVILTYIGLISGIMGMKCAFEGDLAAAIGCLVFSGICDMFDGAIAQRCKRTEEEKLFGIEIDSLCDLVAFGALPALIGLRLGEGALLAKVAAALILLASVIRLGFFNVQELTRDRAQKREGYLGFPVTLISVLYPLLLVIGLLFPGAMKVYAPLCLVAIAGLEVSRIPLKKVYGKGKLVLLVIGITEFILLCCFGGRL
jgi:CDP-diacylglycerol--serine O-phosphatidyltransferase